MLSKVGSIALILAVMAGCASGGGDNTQPDGESVGSPISKTAFKNQSFLSPLDSAAINGGYLLRVDLQVPKGEIVHVDYSCDTKSDCSHVFECPATGRCGPDHASAVTYEGDKATWWGWTDQGMTKDAVLQFKIHFTGVDAPLPPPC